MEDSSLHIGFSYFTEEEMSSERLSHLLQIAQQLIGQSWLLDVPRSVSPLITFSLNHLTLGASWAI